MDPLAELEAKLQRRDDLTWRRSGGSVRIEAPSEAGFAIELHSDDAEWIVALGETGYHEHFDAPQEAFNFVAWALSPDCRVRETHQAGRITKCTLEAREHGAWRAVGTVGFLPAMPWRTKEDIVRRNGAVDAE